MLQELLDLLSEEELLRLRRRSKVQKKPALHQLLHSTFIDRDPNAYRRTELLIALQASLDRQSSRLPRDLREWCDR